MKKKKRLIEPRFVVMYDRGVTPWLLFIEADPDPRYSFVERRTPICELTSGEMICAAQRMVYKSRPSVCSKVTALCNRIGYAMNRMRPMQSFR